MILRPPSLLEFTVSNVFAGFIQGLVLLPGISSFAMMPITIGSLPFDILYFFSGVLAKRGDWLSAISFDKRSFFISSFLFVLSFATCVYFTNQQASINNTWWKVVLSEGLVGMMAAQIVYLELFAFRRFFNYASSWTKFFAKHA